MPVINNLIRYVDSIGMGQAVYDSAFPIICMALILFFVLYRNKYSIPLCKAVISAVLVILLTPRVTSVLALIDNGFKSFDGGNVLRTFTYFPLLIILIAKILKVPVGVMLDYMTPSIVIWNLIGQSVCPFLGCCAGIDCAWGIWNPFLEKRVFPVQWAICLALLGVLVMILRYQKRRGYDGKGKSYPIMLVVYGVIRFFLEFLKRGEKVIFGISGLGIHALFMATVGTVWLLTLEEIKLENKRKAERDRQGRRTYSPQRANIGYPKEDKI